MRLQKLVGLTLVSLACATATSGIVVQAPAVSAPMMVAQSDSQYLQEVNSLLKDNRKIARKVAMKMGIQSSSTVPGTGDLAEQNNALIIRNQFLFRQISAKVGVDTPLIVPISGTLDLSIN